MSQPRLETYAPDSPLAAAVRTFCLDGFAGADAAPRFAPVAAWQPLLDHGTELWLDTGDTGAAGELWCAEFRALTTNNSLLNREVQKGIYDDLVPRAAATLRQSAAGAGEADLVREVAFVLNAVHGLGLVERFGARVSVELHTDLAFDIDASVAYGRRYHAICPTHFIIKVPLTPEGIVAARRLSDAGVPVNFTLGFSARQNLLIARAARPAWCNVFMGRINAFLAAAGLGDGRNAGERATAASQHTVRELREGGACTTKQIGASMRGPEQVPALAGLDVYTMPVAVAKGFLAGGGAIGDGCRGDFPVELAPGVDAARDGLDVFWEVGAEVRAAAAALAAKDVAALDGRSVATTVASGGCPTLFPTWTGAETARIAADGKIPAFAPWRDGVRDGRLAWDTLLTAAGLASFAADQKALDDRIRGLLA